MGEAITSAAAAYGSAGWVLWVKDFSQQTGPREEGTGALASLGSHGVRGSTGWWVESRVRCLARR
jgi:hypothetical protein